MAATAASQPKPLDWTQFGEVNTPFPSVNQANAIDQYEKAREVYLKTPKETNRQTLINALVGLKEKGLTLSRCPKEIDDAVNGLYQDKQAQHSKVELPKASFDLPPHHLYDRKMPFPNISEFYGDAVRPAHPTLYQLQCISEYESARASCREDLCSYNNLNAKVLTLLKAGIVISPCPKQLQDQRGKEIFPMGAVVAKKTFPNIREVYGDVKHLPEAGSYKLGWVQQYEEAREACKNDDTPAARERLDWNALLVLGANLVIDPCPKHLKEALSSKPPFEA